MSEQEVRSPTKMKLTEMMDQRLMREMKNLVTFFYVSLRNARIHGFANEAFQQPLRRFAETLNSLLALEGTLSLRVAESYIFVNEQRLRFDIEGFLSYTRLVEELKGCKIG
ncbi:MAG: hypothetical protein QHH30_07615, partial [candidate division NC10 bacterium]|nr:hypothetical protein [candidate division NC10 bacterium]